MTGQLSLPVTLPDDETFDSFCKGSNSQLFHHLYQSCEQGVVSEIPIIYLSGESGVGKSHLLFAMCHQYQRQDKQSFYLNLEQHKQWQPEMLEGIEHSGLVCLDNIDKVKNDRKWQVAIFDLINRVVQKKSCLMVITANAGPKVVNYSLPDLTSRLSWGVSYTISALSDEDKKNVLMQRASNRGLQMNIDVANFLFNHLKRDMPHLMDALSTLDAASLQQKRKLTIPFIKDVLAV